MRGNTMSIWDDPELAVGNDYAKFEAIGDRVTGNITGVFAHRFDDGKVVPKIGRASCRERV